MKPLPHSRMVDLSASVYRGLLVLYPAAHRRAYGPEMALLFRDQCRAAHLENRCLGLIGLWARVGPDLFATSIQEHYANWKGARNMMDRIMSVFATNRAPRWAFAFTFITVFLFIVISATLFTFILPESYASTARIKIEPDSPNRPIGGGVLSETGFDPYFVQTQFEIMQSEAVLNRVIAALDLNTVWGKKYANGEKLRTLECLGILKGRLVLRPVRNTSLIEVTAYGEDPAEVARIANAITDAYREYRILALTAAATASGAQANQVAVEKLRAAEAIAQTIKSELKVPEPEPTAELLQSQYPPYWKAKLELAEARRVQLSLAHGSATARINAPKVEIVERAQPGLRPVRPNKPLNISLGIVCGGAAAIGLGTLAALLTAALQRRAARPLAPA